MAHENFVNKAFFGRFGEAVPTGTQLDLNAYIALASNLTALLDKLNRLMLHGTMSTPMRTQILAAINAVSATLAQWFGLLTTAVASVFPNSGNFASRNLGFVI